MATTYLNRTNSSAGSGTKFTISTWLKKGTNVSGIPRIMEFYHSSSYYISLRFRDDSSNRLDFYSESNGSAVNLRTNRSFRDLSAWYHIVLAVDTTDGTADDRMKMYINGVQETSFALRTNPSSSEDLGYNTASATNYVGRKWENSDYFDGSMAHVHFIDGTAYDADTFGETDSTTGIWKFKTPSVTYGTNGFFLKFENSAVFGTDSSGEGNTFTVNGTIIQTLDTPTNNFCTLNPLQSIAHPSFTHGNTKCGSSSDGNIAIGTIPSKAGYYEIKIVTAPVGGSGKGLAAGAYDVTNNPALNLASQRWFNTNYGYNNHYATINFGGGNSWENQTTGLTSSAGDIMMIAWKNGKFYAGYNGTWFFGADPSNDTDGSVQIPLEDANAEQAPLGKSELDGLTNAEFNFGNGYFGTTAVTTNSGSGYQDANGQGIFNYQPPTGTYACCTKNLAEFG